jgi:hypothetical protein
MDQERNILMEVLMAIGNTFSQTKDDKATSNPLVEKVMKENFIPSIIKDLLASRTEKGIDFSILKNAFSYFFVKTVDAYLIAKEEQGLFFGSNVLYSYNDIKNGTCGVSEYFARYGFEPDDGYALGEQYFFSFQKVCAKHKTQIEKDTALVVKMISGSLIAMIPYAIALGHKITSHK